MRREVTMATAAITNRYTPEDLLRMPDGDRYELVEGQLVERSMSTWSQYVGGELNGRLRDYCRSTKIAWAFPDGVGYQCFPDAPEKVRKPDGSAVRRERLAEDQVRSDRYILIAPDVAVEVVSPTDLVSEIDEKVQEYRTAGCRLIWVVHPQGRYVQVFRAKGH